MLEQGGGVQDQSGTVKVWFEEKGFGFITPDVGEGDVYVHRTALQDGKMLEQGAKVTYSADWQVQKNKYSATSVTGAIPAPEKGGGKGGDGGYGKADGGGESFRSEPYATGDGGGAW
mmetsp:Transcript_38679/g.69782  ORF Transcript_38679/g.69782 Transcript_38679/m.69782 type:complete len:117 (+) Transcript_38679:3-353(+)